MLSLSVIELSVVLATWCKQLPDAGKDRGQEEKGVAEDEMVGRHH